MDYNDDEPTVVLKEHDINKIREGNAVEFEVTEPDKDEEEDENYFKPEDVLSNTYIPEDDDDEDDDGLSPFEKLAKKMEDVTGDGGVKKRILKPGGGSIVPEEAIIRLHYNAFLEYADEPYDSTRLRNSPERYKLGAGQLLPGLEIAVRTMKKGEIAQLLIAPEYAYGKMGAPPRIPAQATIMFKLELLHFVEHAGIEDFDMMTKEEKDAVEFPQILKLVEAERQFGKQQYNEKSFGKAFLHYKKAAKILQNRNAKDKAELKTIEEKLLTLLTNMAICSSKQNKFHSVIKFCNEGRRIDPNHVKLLFLQGKAHRRCSDFEKARELLKRAQRLSMNNPEINSELQQLDKDIQDFSRLEKDMYKKMFSKPTGQSDAEREKEEEKEQEKEDKALNVSEQFEKLVESKILEFINNKDQDEMPFPAYNLNVGEIACMMEKSMNLGLSCTEVGSGESYRLKITKPKNDKS